MNENTFFYAIETGNIKVIEKCITKDGITPFLL